MIALSVNASSDNARAFLEQRGFVRCNSNIWKLTCGIDSLRAVLAARDGRSCHISLKTELAGKVHVLLAGVGIVISYFFFGQLTESAPAIWRLVESRATFFEWMDQSSIWGLLLLGYFLVALGLTIHGGYMERSWMHDLKKEFGGTILRPPSRGSPFERATWPIYVMSFPLLFWCADYVGSGFLVVMSVLIVIGDGVPNLLRSLTSEDGAAQWRWLFMDSLQAWVTTVMLTLLIVYVLGTGTTLFATMVGSDLTPLDVERKVSEWQDTNRRHFFPTAKDSRQADPQTLARAIKEWAFNQYASKIRDANPFLPEEKIHDLTRGFERIALLKWTIMIAMLQVVLAIGLMAQAYKVVTLPKRWQKNLRSLDSVFSAPGVRFSSRLGQLLCSIGIWLRLIFSGVVNWIAVVISIDIIAYMFLSRTLFIAALEPTLGFADVPSVLIDQPGLLVWRVLLLPFAIVPFFFVAARIQPRSTERNRKLDRNLHSCFVDLCDKLFCRARLRVVKTDRLESHIRVSVIPFLPPVVVVSTGAVEAYSEAELTAVIAHELAHARNDGSRLRVLRLLSLALLLPNDAATMLMDFVQAEFRADEDAATVLEDPASIRSALRKAVVFRTIVEPRQGQEYEDLLRYFFGKSIVGHGHPIVRERLDNLAALEGAQA